MYTFSDSLFGDRIDISIFDADSTMAELVTRDAYEEALRLQKIFNLFDKDSELSRLNRKRKMRCSKELLEVMGRALEMCRMTDGLYDISLGKLFMSRKSGRTEMMPGCTYKDIDIRDKTVSLLHPEVLVDLGSIAKGYIVDRVVEFMRNSGVENGLVNGRGDLRVFGEREHIAQIQHPREKGKIIGEIRIKDEAIATSGDYSQYLDGYTDSHIINNKRFSSVTVVAGTAELADMHATSFSVIDDDGIKKLLNNNKNLKAVTFDKDIRKRFYNMEAE